MVDIKSDYEEAFSEELEKISKKKYLFQKKKRKKKIKFKKLTSPEIRRIFPKESPLSRKVRKRMIKRLIKKILFRVIK